MPGPDTEILGLFSVHVSLGDSFVRGTRRDLSVDVREKLLKFLQDNYPDCFVRTRIMDVGPAAKDGSAGA